MRRACGGEVRLDLSSLIEILLGRDTGWNPQRRDDGSIPWSDIVRRHRWHMALGLVTGVAAFGWNDQAYDADRTLTYAVRELAGEDEQTTAALLTFLDTQHMAPTFGSQPWQPQAPRLKGRLDAVREALAVGDPKTRQLALDKLQREASEFASAPDIIQAGTVDPAFVQQARPWLDAMRLWGRALQLSAAGLEAANSGRPAAARRYFATAKQLAAEATAIQTIPGVTRFDGPIKIADGVLDTFVADAPTLIALGVAADTEPDSNK